MKHTQILFSFATTALLASCSLLLPSPHTKDADYVMKHGQLQRIERKPMARPLQIPSHYTQIQFPDYQYIPPHPTAYRKKISDSITGYLVPDRSLPFIRMSVFLRETTLPTKPEEAALYAVLSPMYRKGGSTTIAPTVLDDSLELLAASIGGDLGSFQSALSLNCISRDFAKTLALLEDVYIKPAFDSTRLELQKSIYLQNLLHKYDRPADLLGGLSRYTLYESGPRLWNAKPEEVKKIQTKDLLALAKDRFATERVIFAVSGDFDPDTMLTQLKAFFDKLPKKKNPSSKPTPILFKNKPGIYIADKKTTQANISMEQPFVQRPHPDFYATSVASYILGGGGFTSRLTAKVRSDEGLAYSVHSSTESNYNETGTTEISLQTKVSTAAYSIKLVIEEIQKLAKEGPTAEELASAKKGLIESMPGIFESPTSTADAFARSELWGRSMDHFVLYPKEIEAVRAEDVKRCIAKYFDPARMTINIVGPADELLKADTVHQASLQRFGKPRIIPLDSLEMR